VGGSTPSGRPQSFTEPRQRRIPPGHLVVEPTHDHLHRAMADEELSDAFRAVVRQFPHRRYRHACVMLARQEAFKIAGPSWSEYFEEHRGRLIEEAKELIASRSGLAKYRR